MLDNFGLGEFFFLAMLALLFFGPERLPRIGARLGRWVSSLTQYSKAFLTEWREEALAVHDAVEEVKGIRDEIVAARAELTSTLDTAREDLTEGVDAAREAVTGARLDVSQQIKKQRQRTNEELDRISKEEEGEVEPDGSGEQEAIERTQQILDGLTQKRQAAEAGDDGDGAETPVEQGSGSQPELSEWERNRQLIATGLDQGEESLPASAYAAPGAEKTSSLPAKESEPKETSPASLQDAAEDAVEEAPEPPKESPYEQTRRVLEELQRKRSGKVVKEPAEPRAEPPAQEAEPEGPERPKMATAFDRTQEILSGLKKKHSGIQPPAEPAVVTTPVSVEPAEFEQLSAQVAQLRQEMAALRQELQALRGATTGADEAIEEAA